MTTPSPQHTGLSWVLAALLLTAAVASCQLLDPDPPPLTQPLPDLPPCPEPVCPEPTCPPPPTPSPTAAPPQPPTTDTANTTTNDRVNINTAPLNQLTRLPGVGPRTAERIIAERDRRPFRRTRDLLRVKGIGPSKFNRLKEHVTTK